MVVVEKKEVGIVTSLKNDLVRIEGLPTVRVNDILRDKDGKQSLVVSYRSDSVKALLLGDSEYRPGDVLSHDPEGIRIPTGDEVLGRVIDALGRPIDGRGAIGGEMNTCSLEAVAPGMASRSLIKDQFYTGVTVVDSLIPIGKGQRELIFGEPDSGKQLFLLDTVAAQYDQGVVCVYAAIGFPSVKVKRLVDALTARENFSHTVVVSAVSGSPTAHIILAPAAALLIAEQFRNRGRDVLIILDDLGVHAKYLRELALLSRRIPGRESYPGDIFFQHAHLLERAGNFNDTVGGGSITMLPVMELDLEQLSTLIPTNLIASTDGHLYFSASLAAEGTYPAIDIESSVTRVGRQSQKPVQISIAERVRSLLASFRDLERFSHLGAEISGSARRTLHRGFVIKELLRQEPKQVIDWRLQILMLGSAFLATAEDFKPKVFIEKKKEILDFLASDDFFISFLQEIDNKTIEEIMSVLADHNPIKAGQV